MLCCKGRYSKQCKSSTVLTAEYKKGTLASFFGHQIHTRTSIGVFFGCMLNAYKH